jgi:hypothetical protein
MGALSESTATELAWRHVVPLGKRGVAHTASQGRKARREDDTRATLENKAMMGVHFGQQNNGVHGRGGPTSSFAPKSFRGPPGALRFCDDDDTPLDTKLALLFANVDADGKAVLPRGALQSAREVARVAAKKERAGHHECGDSASAVARRPTKKKGVLWSPRQ